MTTTASTTSRCYIDVRSTTTLAEPTNLAMLFLSQEMYSLIEPEGVLSTTLDFNGHDLLDSCGLIFRNQYFIYGGVPQYEVQTNRRILQLQDCGLIKIDSDLSFDHRAGACGSTKKAIILCFNNDDPADFDRCRQAASPSGPWSEMTFSTHEHHATSVAPSQGTQ